VTVEYVFVYWIEYGILFEFL